MNMLYPDMMNSLSMCAASSFTEPLSISCSIVIGTAENFLMVTQGPSTETGGKTTLTLDPSGRRVSTIGFA